MDPHNDNNGILDALVDSMANGERADLDSISRVLAASLKQTDAQNRLLAKHTSTLQLISSEIAEIKPKVAQLSDSERKGRMIFRVAIGVVSTFAVSLSGFALKTVQHQTYLSTLSADSIRKEAMSVASSQDEILRAEYKTGLSAVHNEVAALKTDIIARIEETKVEIQRARR